MRIQSKFKSYCSVCYYTIFQGELIEYSGQAKHVDCLVALKDGRPRQLNPRYITTIGKVKKKRMIELLEDKADPATQGSARKSNRSGRNQSEVARRGDILRASTYRR